MGLVHFFLFILLEINIFLRLFFFSDYVKQLWLQTMKITIFPIARNVKQKNKKQQQCRQHTLNERISQI